jgi:NAD+ synthase
VDLSPIADLTKTEVYSLAESLGIHEDILNAAPTDGLFGDDRSDEDQLGASYPELEWAMTYTNNGEKISTREREVLDIYQKLNKQNQHKMQPIPVCIIPEDLRT